MKLLNNNLSNKLTAKMDIAPAPDSPQNILNILDDDCIEDNTIDYNNNCLPYDRIIVCQCFSKTLVI